MLTVSAEWKAAYPEAVVGTVVMSNVSNHTHHPTLDARKRDLEQKLRDRYGGHSRSELKSVPPLDAYHNYFKRFKKTYPVQLQLESVAHKKRPLPAAPVLVQAMFMAELGNLLLTAAHDLDSVEPPLTLDVSKGTEHYVRLQADEQDLKAGDIILKDSLGPIASVVYGPDWRTRLTDSTRRVLFVTYGVPGVTADAVRRHLGDIQANVRACCPQAEVGPIRLYGSGL